MYESKIEGNFYISHLHVKTSKVMDMGVAVQLRNSFENGPLLKDGMIGYGPLNLSNFSKNKNKNERTKLEGYSSVDLIFRDWATMFVLPWLKYGF